MIQAVHSPEIKFSTDLFNFGEKYQLQLKSDQDSSISVSVLFVQFFSFFANSDECQKREYYNTFSLNKIHVLYLIRISLLRNSLLKLTAHKLDFYLISRV